MNVTPGPWVVGYWSAQCKEKHDHAKSKCNYEYTLHTDNEIARRSISRLYPDGDRRGPHIHLVTAEPGDAAMIVELRNRALETK